MIAAPLDTDVFVAGGGPAGLAAAIAARQRGLRVIVADSARPPIDKACGEGLMPDGVEALRSLGIVPRACEAFPFQGLRFLEGAVFSEAYFPGGAGLGIRRAVLHRMLMERAEQAGVQMRWGTPVDGVDRAGVWAGGRHVRCRFVLGADGHHSRIRQWGGIGLVSSTQRRIGFRQHFRITPWSDMVEVYWQRGCQAYVTPVGAREVCVALLSREPGVRIADLPVHFPELGKRLRGSPSTTPVRGSISVSTRLRSVFHGRLALIGDASGAIDALTGAGLSIAFRQALALGDAIAKDDLSSYQDAHRRIGRVPRLIAHLMLLMDERTWIRRRALGALASHPNMFTRLLAVHVGALEPAAIGLNPLAGFACRLLAGRPSSSRAGHYYDAVRPVQ